MRITKEHKADIIRSAVAFKFKALDAEVEAERKKLGDLLYEYVYGEHEAQARAMPKGWIGYYSALVIECDGYRNSFYYTDSNKMPEHRREYLDPSLPLSRERPFPANKVAKEGRTVKPGHPLWKPAWSLVKKHRKIGEEKKELETKLRHLLASVTTLKQLRAAWPEGERFFPKEVSQSTALVPVGLSDQINKALGIPSKAAVVTEAVREAATK